MHDEVAAALRIVGIGESALTESGNGVFLSHFAYRSGAALHRLAGELLAPWIPEGSETGLLTRIDKIVCVAHEGDNVAATTALEVLRRTGVDPDVIRVFLCRMPPKNGAKTGELVIRILGNYQDIARKNVLLVAGVSGPNSMLADLGKEVCIAGGNVVGVRMIGAHPDVTKRFEQRAQKIPPALIGAIDWDIRYSDRNAVDPIETTRYASPTETPILHVALEDHLRTAAA